MRKPFDHEPVKLKIPTMIPFEEYFGKEHRRRSSKTSHHLFTIGLNYLLLMFAEVADVVNAFFKERDCLL